MFRTYFTFILAGVFAAAKAQPYQILRGTVADNASGAPVAFANVIVLNTLPLLCGVTDTAGSFLIPNVPVGRYDVKITRIGYEASIVRELMVVSARQTVLNTAIKENPDTLSEIVIKPNVNKEEPINTMATVSARMMGVEEAKRYAGGFDDPARLASAFAGVASNSGFNGIIVRGNAPRYLQWKMEGIEIPNPNHFGDLKSFGGGILTGLSSQMLANSDFFTGAFPAEYNNALSGVFDIAMRKGNNEKKERTIQIGLIGIDYSEEGYFKKGSKASYLFNYRNSTLALLQPLLPENAATIKYQDFSFKLNFPTKNAGIFSLWGIGLRDGAGAKPKTDSLNWFYREDKQKDAILMNTGAVGLSHTFFLNTTSYIKTILAATGNATDWQARVLNAQLELVPYSRISNTQWNYTLSSYLNKKFNARHTNKTGILITHMNYHILLNKSTGNGDLPIDIVNSRGNSFLLSGYSSSSFHLTPKLTLNVGVNAQLFTLNNHYTIEPRVGVLRKFTKKHAVGMAYGLHSRLENLNFYLNNSLATGEKEVNKNLDFTKAHHAVLSYKYSMSDLLNLKIEPYFQYLFSVPVVDSSSFSFINLQSDWFFSQKLQNTGEGRNYGIDVTLERYMAKGYYFLFTTSVFQSKYKGGDAIWRNSRFNRNYVFNFLIGKEWKTGRKKQNTFGINTRISYQGGNRYSPVDEAATYLHKEVYYDETRAFSLQSAPIMNFHISISYKINRKKTSQEIALKILNATGQADFYGYKYNLQKNTIDKDVSSVVLPNLSYKIEF